MPNVVAKFLSLLIYISLLSGDLYSQTCPTFQRRNNGNNATTCGSTTGLPSNYSKTGTFSFSAGSSNLTRNKIWKNGTLYQDGSSLVTPGTIWFGDYIGGNFEQICFYADGGNGVPPAANWTFEFYDGTNTFTCSFSYNSNGTPSSFTPGTIGTSQTICSGGTPSSLTSVSDASSCSSGSITYQWQSSTTSSSSGFTDINSATSSTYSPGALTQTTYFQRIATCSGDGSVANSNVVTITVPSITSPTIGQTWTGNTVTFQSNVSGGTWSISTNPQTGVAAINSSTGVLTASAAGTGTVTYTTSSPSCTITRNFNINGTSGSLPVTWEAVSAQKQNGQVLINWSTASEQNTKDFEVQYSTNTNNWDPIGTVQAAGNSTTTKNYSFTHQSPLKNNTYNYYRILQRDIDGKFSYSKIVSIVFDEPGPDFLVYPNPADKVATIYLSEASEVSLINSTGSVVWRSKLPAGRNQLTLEKFSSGVYIMRAGKSSQRLVIQ